MVKNSLSRLARAKINLDLRITGRRDDGFHLLDSLVVFADFGDEISVLPSDELTLSIAGPFAEKLIGEGDNLILKAARQLQNKFSVDQGAEIKLVKNLPLSSGIGGGSADAAAVIHLLRELWDLAKNIKSLGDLPLSLGADVPVCMVSETTHMAGIGEILRPVKFNFPLYLLLVNPGVSVSTPDIFQNFALKKIKYSVCRDFSHPIETITHLKDILMSSGNDLENSARALQPEITNVLGMIKEGDDVAYSSMSGSGATCFGIFPTFEAAKRQEKRIYDAHPHWWVQPVRVS